ncbi:helix-turn-helix domain-containing protein [Sphingobacterium sp. PU5-4]|uniref:Helix-turn-helix domain-containing protein n=1 Tax=Sphingobacterium tenebrionis TaxID=3111775 RepID=A0ABU8I9R7_9SPHI
MFKRVILIFSFLLTQLFAVITLHAAQTNDSLANLSLEELISRADKYDNNVYLTYAEKKKWSPAEQLSLYQVHANRLINEGDLDAALTYFRKLDSLGSLYNDPFSQFVAKLSIGEIHYRQKDYAESKIAFEAAQPFIKEFPEGVDRILAASEYSFFYYLNGKFELYIKELEANNAKLDNLLKSSKLEATDRNYILLSKATLDVFLARGYLMNESFDKAESALANARRIIDEHFPDESLLTDVQQELVQGELYFFKKDFKTAIPYFQKIVNLEETSFKEFQYMAKVFLAISYYQLKDYDQSLKFAEDAVGQKIQVADYIDYEMEALRYAYLSSKELGDMDKAQQYSAIFLEQDEALNDTKRSNFVNSIINNLEVGKLKDDLQEKTKVNSNLRYVLIGLAVLIILLTVYVIYQRRMHKENKRRIEEYMDKLEREKTEPRKEIRVEEKPAVEIDASEPVEPIEPDERSIRLLEKLRLFEEGELFTDPKMSLSYLASHLETNTITLSKLINTYKEMNFNDYINGLRIKYIIEKIKNEPKFEQYKISYLAEVSGFSSHSIFSKAFKKSTGFTPSQFLDYLKEDR